MQQCSMRCQRTQWLRTLPALPKDVDSVPSIHIRSSQAPVVTTPVPGDLAPSSGLQRYPYICGIYSYRYTHASFRDIHETITCSLIDESQNEVLSRKDHLLTLLTYANVNCFPLTIFTHTSSIWISLTLATDIHTPWK